MESMRVLPDFLRDKLKEPIGRLISDEKELLRILNESKYIASVGDQVTYTLLKNDIMPVFCVVDFKIKRHKATPEIEGVIRSFGKRKVIGKNPPGCISDDLWNAIETAWENLKDGRILIEVIGEEDLAALPAIFLAPSYVTIIYGLPDKGVVVVKALEENKKKVKEILDEL